METRYDYRPSWKVIILSTLFFSVCALVLGWKAYHNDRGVIINRILELEAASATVLYWVFTALSLAFVVLGAFLAIVRMTLHQTIVLTPTDITAPRSRWSSEHVTIPFRDIVDLKSSEAAGQRFFKIVYPDGNFTLTASMLPRSEDFDAIRMAIVEGVKRNASA